MLLKIFSVFAALAALLVLSFLGAANSHSYPPFGYHLVWADEFDNSGLLDPSHCGYDTEANATGWYNGELQYYAAARIETTKVADDKLTITVRKERLSAQADYGGQAYSSGRLITHGKHQWTYGHFEMRAKLPCGNGPWPSFWMLGAAPLPWPEPGEIDIMEQTSARPNAIKGTIHTKATEGTWGIGGQTDIEDACGRFHTYHATWTPDEITIGDGTAFFAYPNTGANSARWPFDKPFYLLVNLAIGGEGGGSVDDTIFPVSYVIDFIRVYQKRWSPW